MIKKIKFKCPYLLFHLESIRYEDKLYFKYAIILNIFKKCFINHNNYFFYLSMTIFQETIINGKLYI